jgi:antitoxin (DNA-binding transcriptional repressor) of toxin-antitoxin stability system
MSDKTLSEIIRSIKKGKKVRVSGHDGNVVRVTAARILGKGNYSVAKIDDDSFYVTNLS